MEPFVHPRVKQTTEHIKLTDWYGKWRRSLKNMYSRTKVFLSVPNDIHYIVYVFFCSVSELISVYLSYSLCYHFSVGPPIISSQCRPERLLASLYFFLNKFFLFDHLSLWWMTVSFICRNHLLLVSIWTHHPTFLGFL